ncbi:MAG: hypothetical protein K2X08_07545 [Chlamydiales bacterium]|nr:hypothetical protein [Chlamydiales bacterium]
MIINDQTINFYREVVAHKTIENSVIAYSPLTRFDFLSGAGLGLCFLVAEAVKSIFSFSFFNHLKDIKTYAGAICLGFVGALFPDTINQKIFSESTASIS